MTASAVAGGAVQVSPPCSVVGMVPVTVKLVVDPEDNGPDVTVAVRVSNTVHGATGTNTNPCDEADAGSEAGTTTPATTNNPTNNNETLRPPIRPSQVRVTHPNNPE